MLYGLQLPQLLLARADLGAACARTRALQDLRQPGLLARFVQALTGSLLSEDEDEDKGSRGPPGGGGSSTSSGAKGAEGGSQAQQQRGEQGPPASSAAAAMQDPPSGMQLAIAAAGLAALPVVAWSEWVLKSTGEPWLLVGGKRLQHDASVHAWQSAYMASTLHYFGPCCLTHMAASPCPLLPLPVQAAACLPVPAACWALPRACRTLWWAAWCCGAWHPSSAPGAVSGCVGKTPGRCFWLVTTAVHRSMAT